MPPITRNQMKNSSLKNLKTEPYSKENRPTEKRTALLVIENNVSIIIFYCYLYYIVLIFIFNNKSFNL